MQQRYLDAAHAMQSGVAYELAKGSDAASPKHLRVGINSAHVSNDAITQLLLAKGLIAPEELEIALADAMEREVRRYEALIEAVYGAKVELG
jgi:hypothetical protein